MSPHHWYQQARQKKEHTTEVGHLQAEIKRLEGQLKSCRDEKVRLKRKPVGLGSTDSAKSAKS